MEDLISVVVPTYNNAPWLPKCLDSLLNQTFGNLEILVVDDGSVDDTRYILEKYAEKDSRVIPFHQNNGGVTSARLLGISHASGNWIGFCDADDWIEPQMYEQLLNNAKAFDADISHCGHRMDHPDASVRYYYNTGIVRVQDRTLGVRDLLEERIVEPGLCNKLYKKSLFDGLPGKIPLTIKNNEDLLMNFYLFSESDKAVFEDFCPYHYMIREESASHGVLDEHRIYDPIWVHQTIMDQCGDELMQSAWQAFVSTVLFAYAQLCRGMDKKYACDRSRVRSIIRQNASNLSQLSLKNAILVLTICYAPWVFHLVYGIYYRLKT